MKEENEVNSVGSMPPLTVRSRLEALDESSSESRSVENIKTKSEGSHDETWSRMEGA